MKVIYLPPSLYMVLYTVFKKHKTKIMFLSGRFIIQKRHKGDNREKEKHVGKDWQKICNYLSCTLRQCSIELFNSISILFNSISVF